nr:hypothetical protein [Tanacetum cinerariifolium]
MGFNSRVEYAHCMALISDDINKVNIDDPDLTMEQYIQLEEENAHRRGQVYNWETATYGKIWYYEDVHYLRSFEKEFPAIVNKHALTSEQEISSVPTVSYFNDFD